VANFNIALAQYAEAEAKGDIARMIALQPALKFNGGGACARGGGSGENAQRGPNGERVRVRCVAGARPQGT
jgi:hypothetical protein